MRYKDSPIKPAVVLSAHTMGLGVIRALGEMGIPIVSVVSHEKDYGHYSKYVVRRIKVAHPEQETDRFISQLIALSDQLKGSLLIPASDEFLVAVSKNISLLEKHFVVASVGWEIIQMVIDKEWTHACASDAGVPVPKTITPKSLGEAKAYSRSIEYPCLVKPKQSHLYYEKFGMKMIKAQDPEELISEFLRASEDGLEVMFQEFIPGDDSQVVNYNSYFWKNEPIVEFTAQQIRKAPPEVGAPCVVRSVHIPEIIDIGRKLIRAIGYNGFSCSEFKLDLRDGTYKLMEVNGRHNLSGSLAVRCGINFPWLEYMSHMEGVRQTGPDFMEGIYWIDLARDLTRLKDLFHKKSSWRGALAPYFRRPIIAEFNWGDPMPLLIRAAKLIKRFLKRRLMKQKN